MPRAKTALKSVKKVNVDPKTSGADEKNDSNNTEYMSPALELSKFKFEKKQHIKIEFENYSPPGPETSKGLWEPSNWRDFLLNLRNMRANNDAPVDSMGCHMSMEKSAPPEVIRYQSLISLMLSSQTKDQVTFAAMKRLCERGLTVDNVLKMSDEDLGQLIYPVGFWKTKVKYIKKTTQTLKDQYNGDIPDCVEKLCKLTGVGPKMAHICMKVAWNKITGIGVDTHVHRISNRIGWVKKPTPTPEDTRKALESWIPFDLWSEVNHLMVGFGQTICLPIGPLCHECLNRDICPSSGLGRKSPKKSLSPLKVETEKKRKSPMKIKTEIDEDDFEEKMDFNVSPAKKRAQQVKVTKKNLSDEVVENFQVKPNTKKSPMKTKASTSRSQNKMKTDTTKKIKIIPKIEILHENSEQHVTDNKKANKKIPSQKPHTSSESDTKVCGKKRSTKKTV